MRSVEVVGRTKEEALDIALKELKVERTKVKVEVLEEIVNKGLLGLINLNRVRLRVKIEEETTQKAVRLLREILVNMGVSAEVEIFQREDHILLNINGDDLGKLIGRRGQTLNSLQYLLNLAVNRDREEREKIVIDVFRSEEETTQKAVRLLREILVNMGVSAEVEIFQREDHILLNINGDDLGKLIGRRGQTLNSLQYLLNLAVNRDREEREKIVIDVGGYRRRKEENLRKLAFRAANRVRFKGKKEVLYPMSPYERRIIHLALQNNTEVSTCSEGKDPYRRVVISPKEKISE